MAVAGTCRIRPSPVSSSSSSRGRVVRCRVERGSKAIVPVVELRAGGRLRVTEVGGGEETEIQEASSLLLFGFAADPERRRPRRYVVDFVRRLSGSTCGTCLLGTIEKGKEDVEGSPCCTATLAWADQFHEDPQGADLAAPADAPYLANMVVAEKWRRLGCGRELLKAAESLVLDKYGNVELYLHVQDESPAFGLYSGEGYRKVKEEEAGGIFSSFTFGKKNKVILMSKTLV